VRRVFFREAAGRQIVEGIENYYRTTYPEVYNAKRALVDQSDDNVAKIYLRNVFPHMSVSGCASEQSWSQ
jgi:hypothetical protein